MERTFSQKLACAFHKKSEQDVFDLLSNASSNEIMAASQYAAFSKPRPSILHWACQQGSPRVVKLVLDFTVDINERRVKYYNYTPLMMACREGHVEVARLLLKVGANPRKRARSGLTPLMSAIKALKICQVTNDPNVDSARELVLLLLKTANTGVNAVSKDGRTALHMACELYWLDMVKLLLEAGADPNKVSRRATQPANTLPYHYMVYTPLEKVAREYIDIKKTNTKVDIIRILVHYGANRYPKSLSVEDWKELTRHIYQPDEVRRFNAVMKFCGDRIQSDVMSLPGLGLKSLMTALPSE